MLASLIYAAVRFIFDLLIVRQRSEVELRAEVLALRHQLAVLERQAAKPRWRPGDRLGVLAALGRAITGPGRHLLLPSPETLLRWHRELVRRKWAAYRKRPRRPRPDRTERES